MCSREVARARAEMKKPLASCGQHMERNNFRREVSVEFPVSFREASLCLETELELTENRGVC